jgi:hypothetical protein
MERSEIPEHRRITCLAVVLHDESMKAVVKIDVSQSDFQA